MDPADPVDPADRVGGDADPVDRVDADPVDQVDADPVDRADAGVDPLDADAGVRIRPRTCTRT